MGYNNPEQLFKELTTRVLNDPDISFDYKEYIKNCIALNLDLNSKERIIKQIINHYLFVSINQVIELWGEEKDKLYMESFNQLIEKFKEEHKECTERFATKSEILTHPLFQPLYNKKGVSNNLIDEIPEDMIATIQNMNNVIKDLKIPSYEESKELEKEFSILDIIGRIYNCGKEIGFNLTTKQLEFIDAKSYDISPDAFFKRTEDDYKDYASSNRIIHKWFIESSNTDDNSSESMKLLGCNKRKYPASVLDTIFKNMNKNILNDKMSKFSDNIYQQPYYRKMSEMECTISKLEMHNKSFNKHNRSLDGLECNELELNEDMLAELDIMPLYLHHRHLNRIVNANLNITELYGGSSGIPNPNGNRVSRRKTKKIK